MEDDTSYKPSIDWEHITLSISELLPDSSLSTIRAAVERCGGDQEQAVALLLDGNGWMHEGNGYANGHDGKGKERGDREGDRERDRTQPGNCSDDFVMALQLTKDWMEEEQAKKAVECRLADKDIYECAICMDDCCTIEEMYSVEECDHKFCKVCMRGYVETQIQQRETASVKDIIQRRVAFDDDYEFNGPSGESSISYQGERENPVHSMDNYFRIKCPHVTCTHYLDYYEIRKCVDNAQLTLLDQITLNRVHSLISQLQMCIRCGSTIVVHDKSSKFVQCDSPQCGFRFCIVCREEHKEKYTCAHFQARKRKREKTDLLQSKEPVEKKPHIEAVAANGEPEKHSGTTKKDKEKDKDNEQGEEEEEEDKLQSQSVAKKAVSTATAPTATADSVDVSSATSTSA